MKNATYFFLSFLLCGMISCTDFATTDKDSSATNSSDQKDDGSVTRIWKMKAIDISGFPEEDNALKSKERKMRSKGYYISLFPDFTGTLIEHSECEVFEWSLDSVANEILFKNKLKYSPFTELDIVREDGRMKLIAVHKLYGKIILEPYAETAAIAEEDPFHPKNNLWRLRKLDNENSKELTAKANNYLQHIRYLFKAKIDNPNRRFSTVNSVGVLGIYDGGVGVVQKSKIPEDWYSYFFNKEQAIEAWEVVRKRIGKNTLRAKSDGDWIEANYEVLVERLDGN